jgi:DnaK suppressor protein
MSIDERASRTALEEEKARLLHQLDELGATPDGDLRTDLDLGEGFADAAAITAERSEILGLVERMVTELGTVEAALKRLDDGTYGICMTCGNPIPPERLEFRPNAVRCVSCKEQRG